MERSKRQIPLVRGNIKIEDNTCHGCLSIDRVLKPLSKNSELFYHLLEFKKSMYDEISMKLCWECAALLHSVAKFQRRVWTAHRLLYFRINVDRKPRTLSNLSEVKLKLDDFIFNDSEIAYDINVERLNDIQNDTIKAENYTYYDSEPLTTDVEEYNLKEEPLLLKEEEKAKSKPKRNKKGGKIHANKSFSAVNTDLDVDKSVIKLVLRGKEMNEAVNELNRHGWKKKAQWKGRFNCVETNCSETFNFAVDYRRHVTFDHLELEPGPQVCLECEKECESVQDLHIHWDEHNVVYKCDLCTKLFRVEAKARSHVAYKHKRVMRCTKCERAFYSRVQFAEHYDTIHKQSVCDHCGATFHLKKQLVTHMLDDHSSLQCQHCGKNFSCGRNLRIHVANEHVTKIKKEEAYCVECNKQFKTVNRYRAHLATTVKHGHRQEKKDFPCPVCGRNYTRRIYLNRHIQHAHENKTKFYCEKCDKYLSSGYGLRKHHAYVHEKQPKLRCKICQFCGGGFFNNRILENHIRTHTGERPFSCEHCPATFAQKIALISHTRSAHTHNKKNSHL